MSSAVSSVGSFMSSGASTIGSLSGSLSSFLKSRTFQHLSHDAAGLLGMYGTYRQAQDSESALVANFKEQKAAYEDFAARSYGAITNLNTQYGLTVAKILDEGRDVVGKSLAAYADSGVNIWGSAVQTISYNMNELYKYKMNAYMSYLSRYSNIVSEEKDMYRRLGVARDIYKQKEKSISNQAKVGLATQFFKLF